MSKAKERRSRHTPRENESFALYTAAELAEKLGVKVDTLRKWRIEGRGPPFIKETSRSILYMRDSVDKWLKKHERVVQHSYKRRRRSTRADKPSARPESPGA